MKFITHGWVVFLSMSLCFQDASADALLVLGQHAALKRTIIVGPGSTDAESGANLKSALESVTATAAQPWMIKIEPGIYDIGESSLQMKPYVDIEGSGQGVTVIKGRIGGLNGVVQGSSDAEIRELKIVNTFDGDDYGVGIAIDNASPDIRNLTIEVLKECQLAKWYFQLSIKPETDRGDGQGVRK